MSENHVLCYVSGSWAYFTSKPLKEQWGDDWNDAPYEHNAGTPYGPCWHNEPVHVAKRGSLCKCSSCFQDWNSDGTPGWSIVKVAWEGPFIEPDAGCLNSRYSVQMINSGAIAWLRTEDIDPPIYIWGGTTIDEFITLILQVGGRVWREVPATGDLP